LLSLLKTVNEMEKLEGMHRAALDSYNQVLRAVAEYPVEADPSEAELYQRRIEALRKRPAGVSDAHDYQIIHSSFRGEVRLYRDTVNEWLTSMRSQLKAAAEAMQTLSIRVAENRNGHEERLRTDFGKADRRGARRFRADTDYGNAGGSDHRQELRIVAG